MPVEHTSLLFPRVRLLGICHLLCTCTYLLLCIPPLLYPSLHLYIPAIVHSTSSVPFSAPVHTCYCALHLFCTDIYLAECLTCLVYFISARASPVMGAFRSGRRRFCSSLTLDVYEWQEKWTGALE
jgi:hypothetical protein